MIKKHKKQVKYKSTFNNQSNLQPTDSKTIKYVLLIIISIFTYLVFYKVIDFQFVNWDDPFYITDNQNIRDFSLEGFKKIFTTPVIGMYNPITFVCYSVIYKIWGLDPHPYHALNLILHIIATITIFNFIFRLTKRYETATIVALLFSIHPMHVSVVCWVSQIKTSLFLIFYFLAIINYLNYLDKNFKIKYLVYAALFFIFSAMSKPSAVSLPLILFLIDYYLSRKLNLKLIYEKLPFFLIALTFGILTLITHDEAGDSIFEVSQDYSWFNNILVSNYSIVFYFNKLFFPFQLCTIYPYPEANPFLPLKYYLSIPIIPLIIWTAFKSGKFKKEMVFGLLFFTIAIAVLIRLVPSGFFRAANRYTYLSYSGLFFIIGQYYCYVIDNKFSYSKKIRKYLIFFILAFLIICSIISIQRINVWQNSITLFNDIIEKKPKLVLAYNNRAVAKKDLGDFQGAIEDFSKSIEIDSNYSPAYNNRGEIKRIKNDFEGALKDYNKAILIDPKYSEAYNNKGIILFNSKKYSEAIYNYNLALKFNSKNGASYHNRALAKVAIYDTIGALSDWEIAAGFGIQDAKKAINMYSKKQ